MAVAIPAPLDAGAFPDATPLHAFFAWNEARRAKDRRYIVACDVARLLHGFDYDLCAAHLAGAPLGLRRSGRRILASSTAIGRAREFVAAFAGSAAVSAAQPAIDALRAAVGASDPAAHAAVFRAFEELAEHVDLNDLARLRAQRNRSPPVSGRRRILVIKLGALGDFIQALGPVPAIRSHHAGDRLILLTRGRYAELAAQTGLFDDIMVDPRPRPLDVRGWLALRHMLRRQHFDRVYDFQTSDRSNFYPWLLRPGKTPQWSGTAWRCSHPHANRGRDRQHTMDRQAEQLLMAGIYPVPLTPWLPAAGALPAALIGRRFALLVPGSSPGRPEKRWPVHRYGELARLLSQHGYLPAVVGAVGERELGRAICAACPTSVDLVGQTDVAALAALARAAALTVGNDTGATHVAAAGGNPVVVLFSGASNPDLCAPRGAQVRVLAEPDLADLAVETVLAALAPGEARGEQCALRRSEDG
jgi:ADP-heptose:LPS heptosyltransferase